MSQARPHDVPTATPPVDPPPEPAADAPAARSLLDRVGLPRSLAWGYAGLILFMIGDGIEAGYLSPYLVDEGYSKGAVGAVFTVYGVAAAIGAFLAGALADSWGPRRVMAIGAGFWAVFHVLLLAVALPLGSYALIMVSYGIRGLGYPLFAYGFMVWIMAAAPRRRIGAALGWYWFCFTLGLPTLGSLLASVLVPAVGAYETLWISLVLVLTGSAIALVLLRERTGFHGLLPEGQRSLRKTLTGSVTILLAKPTVGVGAVIRLINTTSQFGLWVFLPLFFTDTLGFELSQWLRLLTVMMGTNLVFVLIFGTLGDRWSLKKTIMWCGGVLCTASCLALYYLPLAAGADFLVAALAAGAYGAGLAGYVPLPPLMTAQAPERKGQVMSAYSLGAGASVALGPLIGTLFIGPCGVQGVIWIYAALHLLSSVLVHFLPEPGREPADRPAHPLSAVRAE
ncbi:MFS transporter [Streptomyces sp. HUAS TT7]|uniref:MFS transporter n=1 Tax=Streptomyces sp. HUAS TT7 TaxID=3447507 RepID=UPI003F654DF9